MIEHGFTSAPTQYRLYGRRQHTNTQSICVTIAIDNTNNYQQLLAKSINQFNLHNFSTNSLHKYTSPYSISTVYIIPYTSGYLYPVDCTKNCKVRVSDSRFLSNFLYSIGLRASIGQLANSQLSVYIQQMFSVTSTQIEMCGNTFSYQIPPSSVTSFPFSSHSHSQLKHKSHSHFPVEQFPLPFVKSTETSGYNDFFYGQHAYAVKQRC